MPAQPMTVIASETHRMESKSTGRSYRITVSLPLSAELEESVDDTTLTDTLRMAAILQERNYDGFSLTKTIFLDQNHCEVAAAGFHWGLMHALRK